VKYERQEVDIASINEGNIANILTHLCFEWTPTGPDMCRGTAIDSDRFTKYEFLLLNVRKCHFLGHRRSQCRVCIAFPPRPHP